MRHLQGLPKLGIQQCSCLFKGQVLVAVQDPKLLLLLGVAPLQLPSTAVLKQEEDNGAQWHVQAGDTFELDYAREK